MNHSLPTSLVERDKREDGFILVAALWILAALAALAGIYSTYSFTTAATSHLADDRLQAEASIRAGVELTAYHCLTSGDAPHLSHGSFVIKLGQTRIIVSYRSEAARIDLNSAPRDLLKGLFEAVGVANSTAQGYAKRIVGWRKKVDANTDNPEAARYASAGLPYRPRQAPFTNTLELSLVLGLPSRDVERILPYVTVFSGKGQVDAVDADPTTLAALPGMTTDILNGVLQERQSAGGTARGLLVALGPARNQAMADPGNVTRASIVVEMKGGRRVHAEVVIRLRDNDDEPFDILYWQDDFDGYSRNG